jgi:crotonobetainyl-CoA:carnitine CoA-transferase CaiB-like acyl-CoA transferase
MQLQLDHPASGKVASVANPIRFSQTPVEYHRAPPLLGQHTDAVLNRLLELDANTLTRLHEDGTIA